MIEQTKFTYSHLMKVFRKEANVHALKSLKLSNTIDGLNQIKSMFPQKQLNGLITKKLKKSKKKKKIYIYICIYIYTYILYILYKKLILVNANYILFS